VKNLVETPRDEVPRWVEPRTSKWGPRYTEGVCCDRARIGYPRYILWKEVGKTVGEEIDIV
jgi:hypothetical protein